MVCIKVWCMLYERAWNMEQYAVLVQCSMLLVQCSAPRGGTCRLTSSCVLTCAPCSWCHHRCVRNGVGATTCRPAAGSRCNLRGVYDSVWEL